jgi:predicted SprT family Zn-dependent metalloprotease
VNHKQIKAYVDSCKEIMGLGHWEITVSPESAPDDSWADIEVSTNLYHATIRFSPKLWDEKPEDVKRVVAHELIHIHQAGVERLVETLEKPLGSAAYEMLSTVWDVESERSADSLSKVIAQLMPEPKEKKMPRNYRKEYDTYHGTDEQIENRSSRNKARRKVAATKGKAAVKGKEVDHKNGNPKDNKTKNLQLMSRRANRQKGG